MNHDCNELLFVILGPNLILFEGVSYEYLFSVFTQLSVNSKEEMVLGML